MKKNFKKFRICFQNSNFLLNKDIANGMLFYSFSEPTPKCDKNCMFSRKSSIIDRLRIFKSYSCNFTLEIREVRYPKNGQFQNFSISILRIFDFDLDFKIFDFENIRFLDRFSISIYNELHDSMDVMDPSE